MRNKQGTRSAPCSLIARDGNIILVPFHFSGLLRLLVLHYLARRSNILPFVLRERNVRSAKARSSKRRRVLDKIKLRLGADLRAFVLNHANSPWNLFLLLLDRDGSSFQTCAFIYPPPGLLIFAARPRASSTSLLAVFHGIELFPRASFTLP